MGVLFFFNDTATTEIYTLSLHDALPISAELGAEGDGMPHRPRHGLVDEVGLVEGVFAIGRVVDRKSTRLNSSHQIISYAVFCLKKKIQSSWARFFACLRLHQRLTTLHSF